MATPDPLRLILERLPDAKRMGDGKYRAKCPSHGGTSPNSLSITAAANGNVLLHCHGGCTHDAVCSSLGVLPADLFAARNGAAPPRRRPPKPSPSPNGADRRIVATYDYTTADGELVFQVVRFEPKDFCQRRPDSDGKWIWNLDGVQRVLYRLDRLTACDHPDSFVFVVEGEKDADRLNDEGGIATTTSGGAKNVKLTDLTPLHGRQVVIVPDNDADGEMYAASVAKELHGKAASCRVVRLPNLPEQGDVSDWLDAGSNMDELVQLAEQAELWVPSAEPPPPQQLSKYQPLPVDALPEPVRGFVRSASAAIGCDAAYVALPLLSALASAIGDSHRVLVKGEWHAPAIVWTCIVGESGTMKSPAMKLALKPVRERQAEAMLQHQAAKQQHDADVLTYERDLREWKTAKGDGEPPVKPPEPKPERTWADDTTTEALAKLLADNPRGVLLASDELAGWLSSFDRYTQGGKGGDAAKYLSIFDGGPLMGDRVSRDPTYVPRAVVSICGGIQPGTLRRSLGSVYRENGLAARLLLAMPPRRPKRWSEAEVSQAKMTAVAALFANLFSLQPNTTDDGETRPVLVPFTDDGKAAWVDFYNSWNIEAAELMGDLAAAWSKLEGYVPRLALVLHFVRWHGGEEEELAEGIDERSVSAAVELVRWFGNEAKRIYAMLDENEADTENRRLVEWIHLKGGSVTPRDMTTGLSRYRGKTDAARAKLEELAEAGYGTCGPVAAGEHGGRPSWRFALTPPDS